MFFVTCIVRDDSDIKLPDNESPDEVFVDQKVFGFFPQNSVLSADLLVGEGKWIRGDLEDWVFGIM